MTKADLGIVYGITLRSDFVDYYDSAFSKNGGTIYKRDMRSATPMDMQVLKKNGVNSVNLIAVNELVGSGYSIIVYVPDQETNGKTYRHMLMDVEQARMMYYNYLATGKIELVSNKKVRVVSIGDKTINIAMTGRKIDEISLADVLYKKPFGEPIYSIDFANTPNGMIAIDCTIGCKLSGTGIEGILKPDDVAMQVRDSVLKYSKLRGM